MNRILKAYSKRLTNLSTRNKSLLLPSLPSEQFLDVHDLDFLLNKPSFEVVRQLIQRKDKVVLCDAQDPRFEKVNETSKRIRKIASTSRFIEEERGSRDLYLGYPFVKGKLADGTPIHAPLLFFPVDVLMEKEQWCLLGRDDEGVFLNRSFALAYALFNQTVVSDEILEKPFEDFPLDALEFRTALYEWLKESPFKINFNQQLFENQLSAFEPQSSAMLDRNEKNGELKLYSEAVLGIFPQAGSFLVPDYEQLLEQYETEPFDLPLLGTELTETPEQNSDSLRKIREEDVLTPFDIDEAQEEIVYEVKAGKSVVVQGPPGSGKSQLICNLMADFASHGKRVLLVCQKRAALDVVYQRLRTIGAEQFVALIHDFKQDRTPLFQQLATQIEQIDAYKKQNYGLDAVFLERQFAHESRQIDRVVETLDAFRSGLFNHELSGITIKELYLTSDPAAPNFDLSSHFRSFRLDNVNSFITKLTAYCRYTLLINKDHPWYDRKCFESFNLTQLTEILKMLEEWPALMNKQISLFQSITGTEFEKQLLDDRPHTVELINSTLERVSDNSILEFFNSYSNSTNDASKRLDIARDVVAALENILDGEGIESTLNGSELYDFKALLVNAVNAKGAFVSGLWWDVFDGSKKRIAEVARHNGLDTSLESLIRLGHKVNNRIKLEGWLSDSHLAIPATGTRDPEELLRVFRRAEKAAQALLILDNEESKQLILSLSMDVGDVREFHERMLALQEWLVVWDRIYTAVTPFLTPLQIQNLLDEPVTYSKKLSDSVRIDFDSMVEMDQLWAAMKQVEREVLEKILENAQSFGLQEVDQMIKLFDNSLRLAWIDQIELNFPELRAVSSLKMTQLEEDLRRSVVQKQVLSSDILRINLREKIYSEIENNRLGNRVTYREVNHQVTKKRKVWPIRKLLESYSDEVFSLVPCWMASPEAVSAIFPLQEGMFDLVIFDEASQCYAEYGLPASFRGKQLVIAGDSKQLRPTDLYRIRYEEKPEQEDVPAALETESLLDLAAQSLPQFLLTGHYRSRSLDLIGFSNQHFYKNRLRMLPDFDVVNGNQPGIVYVKVDGLWKNNANMVEVEKVIELLKELSDKQKSIGVVTFNFQQQQAIQEAVEQNGLFIPGLFVKNIENVQGDERDIIIFTTAYAPDSSGKLSLQFGTLNMQGGENRLNVAITRARERIYLVTSLDPVQLRTEHLMHEGPKLLKAYMEYALEVSSGRPVLPQSEGPKSKAGWFLKERMKVENEDLGSDLPFSDLVIKGEGVYKQLILTDDDLYHNSKSSKDPHAYLPLLLKLKNWPFQRVYSREYWLRNRTSKKIPGL